MAKSYADVRSMLQQYRNQKAAQERREKLKQNLRQPWKLLYQPEDSTEEEEGPLEELAPSDADRTKRQRREKRPAMNPMTPRELFWWKVKLGTKIAVWLSAWIFFIYIEFGAVFFIFSVLFFMYTNLGHRDKGPSAYSVFNSDCERLQGTFTAEDFDASLRSGMGLVR